MRVRATLTGLLLLVLVGCAPATTPAPSGGAPAAPGGPAAPAPAPAIQRTLAIAVRGEPPTLATRPVVPFSNALRVPLTIFNATLDTADEREVASAYLAENIPQLNSDTWRVFPDGKMETTWRLKPNLTWHDGTALTAEDFAFAYRVYSTPGMGASTTAPVGFMEEVTAPDSRTVVIRWKQPYAEANALRLEFQALPRHLLQQPFAELDPVAFTNIPFWTSEYVGLGPYRLERWEPGAFIEGRAFDGHVLGKPKIDRVKIVFLTDPNSALANLLAGEVHYIGEYIFTDDHAAILEKEWATNQGGTVLYSPTALRATLIQQRPEVADPPALMDLRVRKALAHGMDAATANEVLYSGRALLTSTLTSPRLEYYAEIERVITKYPYDARRAQQLMEEAGFARGANGLFTGPGGAALRFGVWSSSGPKNENENAVLVDGLRRAGFDAAGNVFSAAQLADTQARALIPGLSTRGVTAKPLKDNTSAQIPRPENRWTGENRNGWSDPAYDRLFEAFNQSLDRNERIRLIAEMERMYTENVPSIPHYYAPNVTAHLGMLKGPVARQTPDADTAILKIQEWEWKL